MNKAKCAIFSVATWQASSALILALMAPFTATGAAPDPRNLVVSKAPAQTPVTQHQRVALVIGNASYKDAPLTNPVNDARGIAEALKDSGFSVIARENVDQKGMLAALREFGDRLRGGGTGLFYFAGHGMQIKGRNYLVPVGSAIEREDEVAYGAVDAQAVLDKMEAAGNGTNIMILDACRNNPFLRSFRSGQSGLAQMDAPIGTLVSFATSPGTVASDGGGQNGLFTQHLLKAMREPGLKVEDVFKQVRSNVRRDSQGKQVPWESTSLEGDFYFKPAQAPAKLDTTQAVETAVWDAVKDSANPLELRVYLNRYPQGVHAAEARAKLAAMAPPKPSVPLASAVPAAPAAPAAPVVVVPPVTAPVTPVAPTSHATGDQADVDRRTQEILAELGKASPSLLPANRPTDAVKAPAALQTNARGISVGDRWRYQVVDKYKGEVVRNYAWKVDGLLPDGDLRINGGRQVNSSNNELRSYQNDTWAERGSDTHYHQFPAVFRTGHKESFRFKETAVSKDGSAWTQDWEGTLEVKGKERVRVPAGEFDAWRIERVATYQGTRSKGKGQPTWYGRNTVTTWYAPEVHNFVARDEETRQNGSNLADRLRVELTSFERRTATVAKN